jgi:MGT family glycosyltransferase
MSKVVFYGFPIYAHLIQTLPLVQELVKRGEDVTYFVNPRYKGKVELAGANYREYLKEYDDDPSDMVWNYHKFMDKVYNIVQRELVIIKDIRPDYIIFDRSAVWAPIIGEKIGVPTVCTISSLIPVSQVVNLHPKFERMMFFIRRPYLITQLVNSLKAMRTWKKIATDFSYTGHIKPASQADLVLANFSREFQPFADSLGDRYKFIGWLPSMEFRSEVKDFSWRNINQEKIIYVSLGTTYNRDTDFYEKCFASFKNSDYKVIISTGKGQHLNVLKDAPSNFIIAEWVPQLEVLSRADVFVTQGGTTSVCESLYHGCPVVVVPQMAEQHVMGYWVDQLMLGTHLKDGRTTVKKLRSAVDKVISDPQYRENSKKIGASFINAGGVKYAVDEIFNLKKRFGIS